MRGPELFMWGFQDVKLMSYELMLPPEYHIRKIVSALLDRRLGKTSLTYERNNSNIVEKKSN
jgi:hypothetical protein